MKFQWFSLLRLALYLGMSPSSSIVDETGRRRYLSIEHLCGV